MSGLLQAPSSLDWCKFSCIMEYECAGFSYNRPSGLCQLKVISSLHTQTPTQAHMQTPTQALTHTQTPTQVQT